MDFKYSAWMVLTFTISFSKCGNGNKLRIFRRERDIFTNLNYSSSQPDRNYTTICMKYNAECRFITKCRHCVCKEGMSTFVINGNGGNNKGSCIKDEELNLESESNIDAFTLENSEEKGCLKQAGRRVIVTICGNSLDEKWIRLNNKQLMNVKSLRCITSDEKDGQVIMTQCRKNGGRQKLMCEKLMYETISPMILYFKLSLERGWYLEQDEKGRGVFTTKSSQHWTAHQNGDQVDVCSEVTEYKGCYRLSDGNFWKYLNFNNNSNMEKFSIFAPINRENKNCDVEQNFTYTRDSNKIYKGSKNLFTLNSTGQTTKEIKINEMNALRRWNGSLLQITIKCMGGGKTQESHCILIKLQSLLPLEEEETPSPSASPTIPTSVTKVSHSSTLDTIYKSSSPPLNMPGKFTTPQLTGNEGMKNKSKADDNTPAIVAGIIVLVVVAIIVLSIFVYRRRKKRSQSTPRNSDKGGLYFSKAIYEEPDRSYATINEAALSQTGETADTYSYPDSVGISNPVPDKQDHTYERLDANLEYTYAKCDDLPASKNSPSTSSQAPSAPPYEELWRSSDNNLKIPRNVEDITFNKHEGSQQPQSKPVYEVLTNDSSSNIPYETPGTVVNTASATKSGPVYEVLEDGPSRNSHYEMPGATIQEENKSMEEKAPEIE